MAEFPTGDLLIGTQYYRFPTPTPDQWANDLRNIAQSGFNTVKLLVSWRPNELYEGQYVFSDIVQLMDLAQENGLRVIINTLIEGAPAWFTRKYPDSLMITCDGRIAYPRTIACRQTGGSPGPCLHHAPACAAKRAFLTALAKTIGTHPALYLWDLWNEPELSSGIYREPILDNLLCYCEHSRQAFIEWLRRKYGTVEAFNDAWHGAYGAFEELELPRDTGVFKPMVDFRQFFVDSMVDELRMRVETVRAIDPVHPLMAHTVPLPYFNVITTASNDYRLSECVDVFGNSLGTEPFAMTAITSAARGKVVINSEIHAVGGSTYSRPNLPAITLEAFKRHLMGPLARGIRGMLFWQYRPETLGFESPAWGLTNLDGTPAKQLRYASDIARAMAARAETISACRVRPARAAILISDMNQIFLWCMTGSVDLYNQSLFGLFESLYGANIAVDILSEAQVTEGALAQYDLAIAPIPYYLSLPYAESLRTFVQKGGTLIAEAFFGGLRDEDGYHAQILPGYGFDAVFGCREADVLNASVFNDAYSKSWGQDDPSRLYAQVNLARPLPGIDAPLMGYNFTQGFQLTGGRALAHFADGRIAAVENEYGNGHTILFGTILAYGARKFAENARLFAALAEEAGIPRIADAPKGLRVDVLDRDGAAGLVLFSNRTEARIQGRVSIPNCPKGIWTELYTGASRACDVDFSVDVAPGDTEAWIFEG